MDDDHYAIVWALGISTIFLYLFMLVSSGEALNAAHYSALIGNVETRQWSQDIQPKDPNHIRLVSSNNANFLATKAMGQDGSIGSQFHLGESTLQLIKGELWYVFPLEYDGLMVANSTGSIPGYVMVSAENPEEQPKFVKFASGAEMVYSPSAYFGNNLERHLRTNGYFSKGLTDFSFELDENYHPWWVVSVFTPTIGWWGIKIDGIVVVDPASGSSTFYPIGSVPAWIDRVVPDSVVNDNIAYWGDLKNGWWNSSIFGGKVGRLHPGNTTLIYGNNGDATWVTDVTSMSANDDSMVGVIYTDAHTGKTIFYQVPGGGTNKAVVNAVNRNQDISYRKLTGVDPQLYNLYGEMVDILPVVNENSAFQGVAIVEINNIQQVSFGSTMSAAMSQFQKSLSGKGINSSLDKNRELNSITGSIDRIGFNNTNTGTIYYIHVAGIDHLFNGDVSTSIKLPVSHIGDKITLTYYYSEQSVLPIHDFDNESLPLSSSQDQQVIETKVDDTRAAKETHEDANSIRSRVNNMSDEQIQKLTNK